MENERKPVQPTRVDLPFDLHAKLEGAGKKLNVSRKRIIVEGINMWLDSHRADLEAKKN